MKSFNCYREKTQNGLMKTLQEPTDTSQGTSGCAGLDLLSRKLITLSSVRSHGLASCRTGHLSRCRSLAGALTPVLSTFVSAGYSRPSLCEAKDQLFSGISPQGAAQD